MLDDQHRVRSPQVLIRREQRYRKQASLAPHLHAVPHEILDVERAAPFHQDYFEFGAALKCVLTYFLKRAWKRDFFNSTLLEALLSNVLYTVRNVNTSKILAQTERLRLNPFQRGRKFNSLYRALTENCSFILPFIDSFLFAKFL